MSIHENTVINEYEAFDPNQTSFDILEGITDLYNPNNEFKEFSETIQEKTTNIQKNGNLQLRPDISIPIVHIGPWNNSTINPDICGKYDKEIGCLINKTNPDFYLNDSINFIETNIKSNIFHEKNNVNEKQKLQTVLSEVLKNIVEDDKQNHSHCIDDIFTKIRILYDAATVPIDSNKLQNRIIFINHEDDTIIPALKIDDLYMQYIFSWYEMCNLILDIEETDIYLPISFTKDDFKKILFQTLHYKYKDEFLNVFIPTSINDFFTQKKMASLRQQILNDPPPYITCSQLNYVNKQKKVQQQQQDDDLDCVNSKKLIDLGIVIPKNLTSIKEETKTSGDRLEIKSFMNNYSTPALKNNNNIPEYKINHHSILPFNSLFTQNCEIVTSNFENKVTDNNLVLVLMNIKYLQTITIKKANTDILHIVKNYPEFGFIQLFALFTNNEDIIEFIQNEYNQIQFDDVDEINKKLLVTSQYIDYSIKHETVNMVTMSEESTVKKFIQKNFILDDNIENKMKASSIYNIIIESKCVHVEKERLNGFKNRLSKYFKDLKLKKKRYNNGYYYYGIRVINYSTDYKSEINREFNQYLLERDNMFVEKPPPVENPPPFFFSNVVS